MADDDVTHFACGHGIGQPDKNTMNTSTTQANIPKATVKVASYVQANNSYLKLTTRSTL